MNTIIIPEGFLLSEKIFKKMVEFISVDDMNISQEDFLFVSDQRLDEEVSKIVDILIKELNGAYDHQKKQYTEDFSVYFKKYLMTDVLTAHIKKIILEENDQVLKYRQHRTKMAATNLVLLDIVLNLNDKSLQFDYLEAKAEKLELSNNVIYNLETSRINEELHIYYFMNEELELRVKQKNIEYTVTKKIAGLNNKLQALQNRYFRKRKKLIREKCSYRNKLKRAKTDFFNKLQELEGQERDDLEKKLLTALKEDKKYFITLKEKTSIQLDEIKIEYQKEKFPLDTELEKQREIESNFSALNATLYKDIEELKKKKNELFSASKLVNNEICKKGEVKFFKDEVFIPNPLKMPKLCLPTEELNKWKKNKRDIIDDCLDYLKSYDLITYKVVNNKNTYVLNLDSWFNSQKHPLSDVATLKELIPLLISYIKYNAPHKVDGFLSHIDEIVDYLFLSPEKFSEYFVLEHTILTAIDKGKNLNILVEKGKEKIFHENIFIDKIVINDDGDKTLTWIDNSRKYEIDLYNIVSIELVDQTKKKKNSNEFGIPKTQDFMSYKEKYNIPNRKKYNTILEVDISLSNFFDIKPLKSQMNYKTESEKFQFCKDNGLDNIKNKIYVTAIDTIDEILHVAKRSIPSVKILEPADMKDRFEDIIKSMCKDMK